MWSDESEMKGEMQIEGKQFREGDMQIQSHAIAPIINE